MSTKVEVPRRRNDEFLFLPFEKADIETAKKVIMIQIASVFAQGPKAARVLGGLMGQLHCLVMREYEENEGTSLAADQEAATKVFLERIADEGSEKVLRDHLIRQKAWARKEA